MKALRKSILTKLICLYLLMAALLIGVLGFTLARSCKQELISSRMHEIIQRAQTIGQVTVEYNRFGGIKDTSFEDFMQAISSEYNTVLQIYNIKGDILAEFNGTGYELKNKYSKIDNKAYNTALHGKVYSIQSYYNKSIGFTVSTVVVPVYEAHNANTPKYIVAVHASDAPMQEIYISLLSKFWVPCIVVIALCVILIVFLNYGITLPLVEMNSIAKEIARGNFDKRAQVSSQDEIGQFAASFNAMAEQLAITDAKRTEFISNISHELRTPLTSINGFVQGILDGTIPQSEQRKYLEIVLAESNRLTRLTREMLDLSRIESGRFPIKMAPFDVNELLRRVIITESTKLDEKQIEPIVDFEQEKLFVMADMECIEQVCVNLFDNAIKFTQSGGNITVKSYISNGKAVIGIADNGKGISEQDLPHIWDRFYTENKARTGIGGMGLGLSIVKRILAEHNQDIKVVSQVGKGTAFTFTLDLIKQKYTKKNDGNALPNA